jgi:RHH-type transcriptional regulator, rel operon repressor / antitoxin RelB
MLALRLPQEIETRLAALAVKTGRSKSFYAKEAILSYLEDMEDYYLAEERTSHDAPTVSLETLVKRYGLED